MLSEIHNRIIYAIDDVYQKMAEADYISYILLLGRADTIKGLSQHVGTDCVIDYQLDKYYDETREGFYLRYLNRNYCSEGFHYQGVSGMDDLSIEMMIYCHLWDSRYFLKSLARITNIIAGKGYLWNVKKTDRGKWDFIHNDIVKPLKEKGLELGEIIEKAYSSNIRNAFAHSLYNVNPDNRTITLRPKSGFQNLTFDEFQEKFLYSVILMNKLQNKQEAEHDRAGRMNVVITMPFMSPDGVKLQVKGEMIKRGEQYYPEMRLVKILG